MGEHDKVLEDAARVRASKPTYAVRVPAVMVEDLHPSVLSMRNSLKRKDGTVLYLLLDGRYHRVTLEPLP